RCDPDEIRVYLEAAMAKESDFLKRKCEFPFCRSAVCALMKDRMDTGNREHLPFNEQSDRFRIVLLVDCMQCFMQQTEDIRSLSMVFRQSIDQFHYVAGISGRFEVFAYMTHRIDRFTLFQRPHSAASS